MQGHFAPRPMVHPEVKEDAGDQGLSDMTEFECLVPSRVRVHEELIDDCARLVLSKFTVHGSFLVTARYACCTRSGGHVTWLGDKRASALALAYILEPA